MSGQTLFAVRESDNEGSDLLQTDDKRFSVNASWWGDHEPGFRYALLVSDFRSPDPTHSFGRFAVVVDDEGALLQMAVAADQAEADERIRRRMRENDIEMDRAGERLIAKEAVKGRPSALSSGQREVTVRARAYPHSEVLHDPGAEESLLCLRLVFEPFGAVQIVISDLGRLLAMATGRHERQAYQRVCHELARRGLELEAGDLAVSAANGRVG
jgi:hypothetical protein